MQKAGQEKNPQESKGWFNPKAADWAIANSDASKGFQSSMGDLSFQMAMNDGINGLMGGLNATAGNFNLPGMDPLLGQSGGSESQTVRAGDYGGSLERIARAQLPEGASQREINNYVGQLFELNSIKNARSIQADQSIQLPTSGTAAATSGLGLYGKDIAIGEQQKAAAQAQAQWNISQERADQILQDRRMAEMEQSQLRRLEIAIGTRNGTIGSMSSLNSPEATLAALDGASRAMLHDEGYLTSQDPALGMALGFTAVPAAGGLLKMGLGELQGGIGAVSQTVYGRLLNSELKAQRGFINFGGSRFTGAPETSILRAELAQTNTVGLSTGAKGVLGETRGALPLQRAGYTQMEAKLASNNGFDGVWVKYGAEGNPLDIIISESKFTSTGSASLSKTNMGPQMSDSWIDGNIGKMMNSSNPVVMDTGYFLDANRSLIRPKINVLNPQGVNRWNSLKP